MAKNIVGALVSAGLVLVAVAEDRLPSLESPCLHGAGGHISKLAALAGPDWREVAEKNRKPELKYLSKAKIIALMQKYADKETGDVGGEPLMGDFRYVSFAVLMSSAVFFSVLLGVSLGEWKGTSVRTKTLLGAGISVLAVGFCTMAAGGK